jgi:hypothetical protein
MNGALGLWLILLIKIKNLIDAEKVKFVAFKQFCSYGEKYSPGT